jgi:aryl-alcohol dehydrogenase-like predicted oxidoreductase
VQYRKFGNTSLRVSDIGFGCSRLGDKSDKEAISTILSAFECGVNFFDTADVYGAGRSERLLSEAFRSKRAKVLIATKAGYRLTAAGGAVAKLKPFLQPLIPLLRRTKARLKQTGNALREQDFSADYIQRAIDGSLRRLRTDYLDVFQLHNPPHQVIESGEFIQALEDAKAQGKIRHYGVSCRKVEDAALCLRHPGISSVQLPVNLLAFKEALPFLELAERGSIAVIAREPLASGYLAGPIISARTDDFSPAKQEFNETTERAQTYQFLNKGNDRTMAQAALRFVLELPAVSVVIAGMKTKKHLEENLAASTCSLTQDEIAKVYASSVANH